MNVYGDENIYTYYINIVFSQNFAEIKNASFK